MSSSTTNLLERLLEEAPTNENREHVLEQAHYAIDNVQQKCAAKFETLVNEISTEWGGPEFNSRTDQDEEKRHPMPAWVTGSSKGESSQRVIRLSYWRREGHINYVLLRCELDSKDRPKYYDLVLGARRKHKSETAKVEKLRHTDTGFFAWILRKIGRKQI